MKHKCHEAVDCTLRDIQGNDRLDGGLTMTLGGDAKHILSVVPPATPRNLPPSLVACKLVLRYRSLSSSMHIVRAHGAPAIVHPPAPDSATPRGRSCVRARTQGSLVHRARTPPRGQVGGARVHVTVNEACEEEWACPCQVIKADVVPRTLTVT
jgi:hypothetical protein